MKLAAATISLFSIAATSVRAHATFQQLWVGNVDQAGACVRAPLSNNPITSVSGSDIACNTNASPAKGVCTVAAGSQVSPEMHQQPGDRTCANEAIGGNHDGPTIVYLAKVSDATTAVGSSASWFKIGQTGLVSKDYWGTDVMNANCGKVPVTIPADIAPGDYLLRAEVIALHVAGSVGGAQFYVSCFQLKITGGGSANPPTVKFPGAYSANDPGILFNLYGTYTTYTVPGPAVYVGGGGSTPPPPVTTVTTVKPPPTSTSKPPVSETRTTITPTTTVVGTVQHYGQCGGTGWTGGTVCVSPYVCTVSNAFYSQCL